MKKILVQFAALVGIGLVAVACGPSGNTASTTTGGNAAPGKKLKVGISIPAADHGWTAGAKYWAEAATKLYPDVEFNLQTADSPAKQISDIETMAAQGVDAVVLLATESAPLTPAAKKLKEAGILLVNVDRGLLEPVADVFLEGDNKAFGRKAAEYIVQKLNGQGNIVILEGIPCTVNTDRVSSAMEVFKANPGIKVLDSQSGKWSRETSLNVMQTMLVKHPKIDAIWSSDDDMSLGAEQALKEAGRDKGIWMLGGGGMKEIVKRIKDGDALYPATVTYPPSMTGLGVQTAVSILKGGRAEVLKFTPQHIKIDVDLVTKENADKFYFPESIY